MISCVKSFNDNSTSILHLQLLHQSEAICLNESKLFVCMESIRYMMYHVFADDVQVYKSFKHEDSVKSLADINMDLKSIVKWAKENWIQLNATKSQAIAISVNNDMAKWSNHPLFRSSKKLGYDF